MFPSYCKGKVLFTVKKKTQNKTVQQVQLSYKQPASKHTQQENKYIVCTKVNKQVQLQKQAKVKVTKSVRETSNQVQRLYKAAREKS